MDLTNKLKEIAQGILSEQDKNIILDRFVSLRNFIYEEDIIQLIVDNEPTDLHDRQQFLFYTLESLIRDVWRQLNTDSLLFQDEKNLVEENISIAKALAKAVISAIEYTESQQANVAQKTLEQWNEAVNTYLNILKDVNNRSIRKFSSSVSKQPEVPRNLPAGNFDPKAVRLAECALLTAFNPSIHVLSTGGKSTYFFDFDRFILNKANAILFYDVFLSEIKRIQRKFGADFLGILEKRGENTVGCILSSDYLSFKSGLPIVVIRSSRRLLVDRIKIAKGEEFKDKLVLPITDNITRGKEIRPVINNIRRRGANVTDIFAVLFRGDDAVREDLEQMGIIRIHALITPEILHYTAKCLIPRVYNNETREMLKLAVKEIEDKHLIGVKV